MPEIVREMGPYRRWLDGDRCARPTPGAKPSHDTRRQLHASLGLLPVDRGQVGYLRDRLLTAGPQEVLVIRGPCSRTRRRSAAALGGSRGTARQLPGERLRAACCLAAYARTTRGGRRVSRDVAARLVAENGLVIARWAEALRPVRRTCCRPWPPLLVEDGLDAAGRRTITGALRRLRRGPAGRLRSLERGSGRRVQQAGGRRRRPELAAAAQANAAAALAALGRWRAAPSHLLRHAPDPTVRSYLIDRLGPGGAEAADGLVACSGRTAMSRSAGGPAGPRRVRRRPHCRPRSASGWPRGSCDVTATTLTRECTGRPAGCCATGGNTARLAAIHPAERPPPSRRPDAGTSTRRARRWS